MSSKTPKRKQQQEKDNESVTSQSASVAKRARSNQDAQLIAIYEGERELRSVTKTYTISKYSSRRSVNSDTSDFLNADSDDIADRLQASKRVSTPSVKTRNAGSSSSAPVPAPTARRGRSKKDNSIINIEPSKRPDGYWSTQPTTTSSSSSSEVAVVSYSLSAANLSAQQALQRDWSEEASGRIVRHQGATSSTAAVAAALGGAGRQSGGASVSVSSTPSRSRQQRQQRQVLSEASSTPIVSAGQQWIAPIAEEEQQEEFEAPDTSDTIETDTAAAGAAAAAATASSASSSDKSGGGSGSGGNSTFAVLVLLLLILANFALRRHQQLQQSSVAAGSSSGKAASSSSVVLPSVARLMRAEKTTLLDQHVKSIQEELHRLSQQQQSNASGGDSLRWVELSAALGGLEAGLTSSEQSLRGTSEELARDWAVIEGERERRRAAAEEARAAGEAQREAREAGERKRATLAPHEYTLCGEGTTPSSEGCESFTNSRLDQLVGQVQSIISDRAAQIAATRQEIDLEWAGVQADLRDIATASASATSEGDASDEDAAAASVDLVTIQISEAVEGLTRSHAELDKHHTHLTDSVGPALTAAIQAKAEAASAAAAAASSAAAASLKAAETIEANKATLARRNHLLDHLVKQHVAATLSAERLRDDVIVEPVEEQEEEEDEEEQQQWEETEGEASQAPSERRRFPVGEGVVDYAVGPRGGIILNHERLTSRHHCRTCTTTSSSSSPAAPPASDEEVSPLLKAAHSLVGAVSSALAAPEQRKASSAARRSILSHRPPQLTDPAYTLAPPRGRLTVRLFAPVNVTQVSVVHVVGDSAELLAAAPREVRFLGYASDPLTAQSTFDLGTLKVIAPTKATAAGGTYSRALDIPREKGIPPLVAVTAEVLNNYGNREFTLLYRIKVMGVLADEEEQQQ